MSKGTYQEYLLNEQYRNAANLNARIALHQRFSINKRGWQQWVFDQLELQPGSRVLELGAGPGRLWLDNLSRVPESWDITLSDFSPGMVEQAQQSLAEQTNFHFERIDAQAIQHEDASFDAVIANHMLYHVPNRQQAYAEVRRVLCSGGAFYAATNGAAHLAELDELAGRFDPALSMEISIVPRDDPHWFSLEIGGDELAEYFPSVTLRRYEDTLVVNEVEPILAYVLSAVGAEQLQGERLRQFAEHIEHEMEAAGGAIRIGKDSGLFVARNARIKP